MEFQTTGIALGVNPTKKKTIKKIITIESIDQNIAL